MASLGESLIVNSTLTDLFLNSEYFTGDVLMKKQTIDASIGTDNRIGSKGVCPLAEVLKQNSSIKKLGLSRKYHFIHLSLIFLVEFFRSVQETILETMEPYG